MPNMFWFQLLKCAYSLVFFVIYHWKFNIFGFWTFQFELCWCLTCTMLQQANRNALKENPTDMSHDFPSFRCTVLPSSSMRPTLRSVWLICSAPSWASWTRIHTNPPPPPPMPRWQPPTAPQPSAQSTPTSASVCSPTGPSSTLSASSSHSSIATLSPALTPSPSRSEFTLLLLILLLTWFFYRVSKYSISLNIETCDSPR